MKNMIIEIENNIFNTELNLHHDKQSRAKYRGQNDIKDAPELFGHFLGK